MNSYFQFTLENKKQHEIVFHRFILHNKVPCWCKKKMGFLWKHGESCNERTFPKFFHIILLLIYFQVWCKEIVFFPLYLSWPLFSSMVYQTLWPFWTFFTFLNLHFIHSLPHNWTFSLVLMVLGLHFIHYQPRFLQLTFSSLDF